MTQPFRDGIANAAETISLLSVVVLAFVNVFFASFVSLAVTIMDDHFNVWWKFYQWVEVVILCFLPAAFVFLLIAAILSQMCRIIVLFCRFISESFLCFILQQNNRDVEDEEEMRPLLN